MSAVLCTGAANVDSVHRCPSLRWNAGIHGMTDGVVPAAVSIDVDAAA